MPYISNGEDKIEVNADDSLVDAAERIGVPFSCTEGNCGTCLTEVVSGMEYLVPVNSQEEMFGLHPQERLLCQARFKADAKDENVLIIKT